MRKIKTLAAGLAFIAATVASTLAVQPAFAAKCPVGSMREGDSVSNLAECNVEKTKGDESLMSRVKVIINVALGVIGVVAVVMIIFGGFTYTTSRGDAEKVKKGKNTILDGIVGLIVALLAFAIVNFVLKEVFK